MWSLGLLSAQGTQLCASLAVVAMVMLIPGCSRSACLVWVALFAVPASAAVLPSAPADSRHESRRRSPGAKCAVALRGVSCRLPASSSLDGNCFHLSPHRRPTPPRGTSLENGALPICKIQQHAGRRRNEKAALLYCFPPGMATVVEMKDLFN